MPQIPINDIPISDAEFTVLDFETTGRSAATSRVIEIGLVKIKKLKIQDTFRTFFNPGQHIPYFITDLTGISDFDVIDAPTFSSQVDEIKSFISNSILVAHNMPFDYSFLKKEMYNCNEEMIENETLCTLKLARKLYPSLPSKSLGNLVKHFRIRHKGVHRALGDATATAKLLIKMISHLNEEHSIYSVSELIKFQSSEKKTKLRLIKKSLETSYLNLPASPGVYFFKNKKDEIIYIGKAKNLKKRVSNYFSTSAIKKPKQIVKKASKLEFKITNSELTALLTEAELIKKHNPSFNSQLKKYSNQLFIKINLVKEAPDIASTGILDFDGNDYFGPYNNRDTVKSIIEIANSTFKLRECTEKEYKKKRKCYLKDINRCLAPCENLDENSYSAEIEKAYDFLCGNNQDSVNRLLNKMKKLSDSKKFEEAAQVRDTVNLLLNQLNKSSILAEPINKANVLIIVNEGSKKDYLLLLEGRVFIKNFIPDDGKNYFDIALDNYFNQTVTLFNGVEKYDLERMKIALSWLVKNRIKTSLYYLKNFSSKEELLTKI